MTDDPNDTGATEAHQMKNWMSRARTRVHAPASPGSDYYLCRPPGTKGQYGPPVSSSRTESPVTCTACLRKLNQRKV